MCDIAVVSDVFIPKCGCIVVLTWMTLCTLVKESFSMLNSCKFIVIEIMSCIGYFITVCNLLYNETNFLCIII